MPCTDGSSYACAGTESNKVTATSRIFVKIVGPFAANYDTISSDLSTPESGTYSLDWGPEWSALFLASPDEGNSDSPMDRLEEVLIDCMSPIEALAQIGTD